MSKRKVLAILLFILVLGIFLRFYEIKEFPPGLYLDEAADGNNAREALDTGHFKVFYQEDNGREGLFITLSALSQKVFGDEPWAIRLVSAVFGSITLLGIYFLAKELFLRQPLQIQKAKIKIQNDNSKFKIEPAATIALLSSFFLAANFWHLNFSRIGFRAIFVPFFGVFGIYFLLKGLRRGKIMDLVWAGIFIGLGLYTYIAFRFMAFVVLIPLVWFLWKYYRRESETSTHLHNDEKYCAPCAVLTFILVTFVVVLPLGLYFFHNPADFSGRAGQVSIFSAASPVKEFLKSNLATLGMFFARGDCNWRHNYNCEPELNLLVALFFLAGLILLIRNLFSPKKRTLADWLLGGWLIFMSLPETLTREGVPHALRAIGMIPPVMILSAQGAWALGSSILGRFKKAEIKFPQYLQKIRRIEKKLIILFVLILLFIPVMTFHTYFRRWAENRNVYFAFSTDVWHLGQFLNTLSKDTKKYVIVNLAGDDIRGLPAPAQTVMFATDSFEENLRQKKNIYYIAPGCFSSQTAPGLPCPSLKWGPQEKVVIAFLNGSDKNLINFIQKKFPELNLKVPGDFAVLEN